jgi:MFS transporter, DHA1 family, multidrug resistance protein
MLTGSLMAGLAMDFFSLKFAFPCGMVFMATGTIVFFSLLKHPSQTD